VAGCTVLLVRPALLYQAAFIPWRFRTAASQEQTKPSWQNRQDPARSKPSDQGWLRPAAIF
jgi:hypothetical protein